MDQTETYELMSLCKTFAVPRLKDYGNFDKLYRLSFIPTTEGDGQFTVIARYRDGEEMLVCDLFQDEERFREERAMPEGTVEHIDQGMRAIFETEADRERESMREDYYILEVATPDSYVSFPSIAMRGQFRNILMFFSTVIPSEVAEHLDLREV